MRSRGRGNERGEACVDEQKSTTMVTGRDVGRKDVGGWEEKIMRSEGRGGEERRKRGLGEKKGGGGSIRGEMRGDECRGEAGKKKSGGEEGETTYSNSKRQGQSETTKYYRKVGIMNGEGRKEEKWIRCKMKT